MKKIISKFFGTKGESLIETLVSILIVALMMTMIAGAVVSAAKVNKKAKDIDTVLDEENITPVDSSVIFTLSYDSGLDKTGDGADFSVTATKTGKQTVVSGSIGSTLYESDGYYYMDTARGE